jgi:hypothetical protein
MLDHVIISIVNDAIFYFKIFYLVLDYIFLKIVHAFFNLKNGHVNCINCCYNIFNFKNKNFNQILVNNIYDYHNPNLGIATKARVCKVTGQEEVRE